MKVDLVNQVRRDCGHGALWRVKRATSLATLSDSDSESLLWNDPDGCLSVSSLNQGSANRLRFRQDSRFCVDLFTDKRLIVSATDDVSSETIDHFIADQVIPRAMAGEGQHIIHSAAICHADRAILVMGASGRGKSTLATSFHIAGDAIIGDDAIVVSWRADLPFAMAVYRSLRLLPDSIEALLPTAIETDPVADYTSKRRVHVFDEKVNSGRPLPIAAIFVLAEPQAADCPSIRDMSTAEACMALVENAFALDPTNTSQARERLEKASVLARSIPFFAIDFPRDYASLPAVRAAMLERLG